MSPISNDQDANSSKRPIRIAGASGGFSDRQRAIRDLAALDIDCHQLLTSLVKGEVEKQGLPLKVVYVEGDEVTDTVNRLIKEGEPFTSLMTGESLKEWGYTPIHAQCYLGGAGIAEALRYGAGIVICGRVADAAPAVGAGMWWHGWDRQKDFDQIAGSLICGHLVECAAYVISGYFSGFKRLMENCENLGFPMAELAEDGSCVITKEENGTGGEVSVGTVSSQLLYEIQGPFYYGSDVTACLEDIKMEEIGAKVRVSGIKGMPPPSTTKVGLTAVGGYQAEFHIYICGLDLEAKTEWIERQIRYSAGEAGLQGCPGWTLGNDQRQSEGKIHYEYYVTLLRQSEVQHHVVVPYEDNRIIDIPPIANLRDYPRDQPSYGTKDAIDVKSCGPTTRGPLGWVIAADANVGFYVRNDDEWDWFRSLMTIEKVKYLLDEEYKGGEIERFENPGIRAGKWY
ncbi:hypothetical protein N0V83_004421 [Neocucurbitaria cava]|uniref:Acyclic terpene utilisation N-terminal domain-containing protein n=1 Tax=Neocucurbitaria cava TaxID=798079 RepID=A0A9W9CMX2_9PLEO|nr:hypothetical protein N0V83_004421 [Neocucurbitaria cava]